MFIDKYFYALAPAAFDNRKEITNVLTRLLNKYSAPHRHYHNLNHLESGLQVYFSLYNEIDPTDFFAWAYHDVIYHPLDSDNENKSAGYFLKDAATLGFKQWEITDLITDKILETAHTSEENNSLVNDIDLSVLGMDQNQYNHYADLIHQEYVPPLSEEAFTLGRLQVLERFNTKSFIFSESKFRDKFESQAHMNISAEITKLKLKKEGYDEKRGM